MRRPAALAAAALTMIIAAKAAELNPKDKRSGLDFMAPETRAMQEDDMSNPGMLSIGEGERLWRMKPGGSGVACAGCHGEAANSMRGAALRHPRVDAETRTLTDLAGQINLCRGKQAAPPLPRESPELVALAAYVAHQSRGMVITLRPDAELSPWRAAGKRLYERRLGQLGLSCAACHDERWGERLGGSIIPQAHPTAYPLYRLEWQALGSLQRRLRNCMIGMRAEPYAYGAPEFMVLELYLMSRASGLRIETPGVRP